MKEDPLLERTLPGGYRVTHLVGVGGMGRVYCAEQVALGRTVAVKVVHPHLAHDELASSRFLNEARTASRLSHPNSVAIFDFGRTEEGQPYIVMEYLRGRDLGRVVEAEGPLSYRRIVDVLGQTLGALAEAHALGIVHRDLKPDNIVLEPRRSGIDFVKVVDFGLAKLLEDDPRTGSGKRKLTRPGLVCGTPEYMSPEQGRGDPLDGRADLYSVGIVLFELLAGRVPFVADTATKTLLMHLSDPPPDPRSVAPARDIPAALATVTLHALAKEPGNRFQDAHAFAKALEAALLESEGKIAEAANPKTAIRCRSCGVLNPLGQKFCGDCGASISTSAPTVGSAATMRPPSAFLDPSARPQVQEGPLPLFARDDALKWLEGRRGEAGTQFTAAHVVGDEGFGKTRLVNEFLSACEQRGDSIVRVGPDPTWAKIRDYSLRVAVRALARFSGGPVDPSSWAGADATAERGLLLLFSDQEQPASTPEERRAALAAALRWAVVRSKTNVLVVDDLDFLDGTSRNAFAALLAEPPDVRILVVVTYTPSRAPRGEQRAGERWLLTALPRQTVAKFLPSGVDSKSPGLQARKSVDEGPPLSPLQVEQLIAWSQESRDPPPEHLADLVARRIERLTPDARATLGALVVWGDDVGPDVLASMCPRGTDLVSGLQALQRARLVVEQGGLIRTAHALIRRIAFANIPVGRRRELFEAASNLRPDAPLEVRAKEALHVGTAFEALSLLDTLGTRRAASGDIAGSVSALRRALEVARRELHRGELDDPVGAMLVFARKLAEALAATEKWSDAEGVLREALGNAPPTSEHRARLLGVLASVASARKQHDQARRYVDEAMRVALQCGASGLIPKLEELARTMAAVA
jgi:serine/threonine-protein kinase